jgi:hypothetical protein
MTKEEKFKQKVLADLAPHFNIQNEWPGVCFGQNVRIDCLIKPKDTSAWAKKDIVFGVEFKQEVPINGMNYVLDHLKQTIDYSYAEWKNIGRIPILICPGLSFDQAYSNQSGETIMKHLLGRFGIGELKYTHRGLSIVMSGEHFIWDQSGVALGKKWTFKNIVGCRK